LSTAAVIRAAAARMLADKRAQDSMRTFFAQWLELGDVDSNRKADKLFDARMWQSMVGEVTRFADEVMWNGDGLLTTFLTSADSYLDKRVASIYGVMGPTGDTFVKVPLDAGQRAGFLTQPAFLASHTPSMVFNPVGLGTTVRKRILCQHLPDPPPNVPQPPSTASLSIRERFRMHSADPACIGCHQMIDPVGFGFEQYDVMGRFRDKDVAGFAIGGEGKLTGTDVDAAFIGAVGLSKQLAKSRLANECFAAQFLEYALGRSLSLDDQRKQVDTLAITRAATGPARPARELILALVESEALVVRDVSALPGVGGGK
jgi:hypothetical protein